MKELGIGGNRAQEQRTGIVATAVSVSMITGKRGSSISCSLFPVACSLSTSNPNLSSLFPPEVIA